MRLYQRVGDLMAVRGYVSKACVAQAIELQRHSNQRLGEIFVSMGVATEEQVLECLADQFNYPLAEVHRIHPSPEALELVSAEVARTHLVLPIAMREKSFDCVIADPIDTLLVDHLKSASRRPVNLLLATPTALRCAIDRVYGLEERSA